MTSLLHSLKLQTLRLLSPHPGLRKAQMRKVST